MMDVTVKSQPPVIDMWSPVVPSHEIVAHVRDNFPEEQLDYYPVFEKCAELQVPVSIHTSANWTSTRSSDLGHPRHLDQVACDFPSLRLIMSHGGYPWVLEACLVAWKHPNVYLELGAHRPKYF